MNVVTSRQPASAASRPDWRARFDELTAALEDHRDLWEPRPFTMLRVPWQSQHEEVSRWALSLSPDAVTDVEQRGLAAAAGAPEAFVQWARRCEALSEIPAVETSAAVEAGVVPAALSHGVPARKWRQVLAFTAAAVDRLPPPPGEVVDWCCGKGVLSRALSVGHGYRTVGVEKRRDLCETARRLATEQGATSRFIPADVTTDDARPVVHRRSALVGLHACGVLTDALIEAGIDAEVPAMAVAPCCYHHLGGATSYVPRSRVGRAQDIGLSQGNLRLATAQEKVARTPVRAARRREVGYRLGLDLLFREATGEDVYRLQGPFERRVLDLPFRSFCEVASRRLGWPIPGAFDADAAEQAGHQRAREVRALCLVRGLFRRPMELWLVVDRLLRIHESGRSAELMTFCASELTPRNLMIFSQR